MKTISVRGYEPQSHCDFVSMPLQSFPLAQVPGCRFLDFPDLDQIMPIQRSPTPEQQVSDIKIGVLIRQSIQRGSRTSCLFSHQHRVHNPDRFRDCLIPVYKKICARRVMRINTVCGAGQDLKSDISGALNKIGQSSLLPSSHSI